MRPSDFWHSLSHVSFFGSRVLLTIATNLTIALIGLVTGVLAARLLGPDGRGELAAIQLWPSVIATIAMLGLPDSLVYYTARRPNWAGRYLGTAMLLNLLASAPLMALGYALLPRLLAAQSAGVILAAQWYLLLVPLAALANLAIHSLRGRNDFLTWNGLRVVLAGAWLLVLLIAWMIGWADAELLAGGYIVALALFLLPVMFVVIRRMSQPFGFDLGSWPAMLRYGVPSLAGTIPQMLNVRMDHLLIAALLPPDILGLYVVAVAWSGATQPLAGAFGAVMLPRVASEPDKAKQGFVFVQLGRASVLVGVSSMGSLLLLTPLAVPLLFGIEFSRAVPAALTLVVSGAIAGINSVLEEGLRGVGAPSAVLKAEVIGLVVTAAGLVTLLQAAGITGAALATLLGQASVGGALLLQGWRLTGKSPMEMVCPSISDVRQVCEIAVSVMRRMRVNHDSSR